MIEPPFHYQFRLILIGDSTVGKSTLLRVFTEGRFNENTDPTVGVDFFSKIIEIKDGVRIKLQLWDTGESITWKEQKLLNLNVTLLSSIP